ncbi:MAG: protein kinase [Chloroflexi bacterium GWB2_49_20]|nr:MAG: protein kinase [Chloroflexi bacterium GWB2_49_20]OGN79556.1 MAG: protein kinase [Chloroflexi bacterium GWC2_49_37]OGN84521.1 MAG: protein kinase [Chloroflexi bacterium GWD2_49_16]
METQIILPDNFEETGKDRKNQLQNGTTLVQRYVIQDVIGVGGMGSVYRARDLHFPNVVKLVAVKEMINRAPDPLVRATIVKNFEREANILATLNHPSIPRIYDYFTEDNRSYLVLEFIHGKDLETIISQNDGFLSEEQAVTWGIELCDVLSFLHNHKPEPIIFRDMKPSNVIINQENHIILVDFGIAKPFQSGQKGTMIGTEGYSPPEQYRGEANHSADIYALGATLHHLLTRRDPRLEPPFSYNERPIRKINPAVSLELEAVINVALQYNPPDRFETIATMKEALMAAARKTGLLGRINQSTGNIQTSSLKPLWTFQCEDEIRSSPLYYEGGIYVGSCDNNIYSLKAADGEFAWKYATDGSIVTRPAVYDGNIFIGSEDHRLHVINARSGKINWTYYSEGRIRSSPRISEGHVFFGSDDKALHAVNVLTGRASWKFDAASPVRSTPYVLNETIYIGSESGEFYAIDFRGNLKWRFKAKLAITSSPVVQDGMVFFGSLDGSFYALEARGGWVIWRFRMGKGSIVSPCFADNLIFTGAADGLIYAIEARTSKEIWHFQADHQISGSPVIFKDSIYCGAADGQLYCLEYRTGRLRWKFETQGPITSAPVIFDDIVYVGSSDHIIYALLA